VEETIRYSYVQLALSSRETQGPLQVKQGGCESGGWTSGVLGGKGEGVAKP